VKTRSEKRNRNIVAIIGLIFGFISTVFAVISYEGKPEAQKNNEVVEIEKPNKKRNEMDGSVEPPIR